MELDPNTVSIGGVLLIPFVFGFVEFLKEAFGLQGKAVTLISLITAGAFAGLAQTLPFIPEPYATIIATVVASLAIGMSASGFYKFVRNTVSQ
jgi:hypothetical protein